MNSIGEFVSSKATLPERKESPAWQILSTLPIRSSPG